MAGIIDFYHDTFFYLVFICIFVFWMLFSSIFLFFVKDKKNNFQGVFTNNLIDSTPSKIVHHTALEFFWTAIPGVILLLIAIPSLLLLYSMEELGDPELTVKVIGNQWYWTYEVHCSFDDSHISPRIAPKMVEKIATSTLIFDSNMVLADDLRICLACGYGRWRLLTVDNLLYLPINTHIRLLMTSFDVIHSWAVPSLGIKLDACPGRLNQIGLFIKKEGTFYGQCSEICGVNHGFMPIVVKAV